MHSKGLEKQEQTKLKQQIGKIIETRAEMKELETNMPTVHSEEATT